MEHFHISDLASEILLFIFLHLDLEQLVLSRRVNKQFQEVIDNNQLLWRVFEWEQKDQESFKPALDMFDEYSRSSLEEVSLQEEKSNKDDLLHLMQVLKKSKRTLIDVNLKVSQSNRIREAVELLNTASKLRRLVVWKWAWELNRNRFPLARLAPSNQTKSSSIGQLELLWVESGDVKVDSKHTNSLISFALGETTDPQEGRELVQSFSETLVHLRLGISDGDLPIQPLFCPNLKIFEGWVEGGLSSFLNPPQLQTLILEAVDSSDLDGFPISVEELWLRDRSEDLDVTRDWEPLLRHCPKLRRLKLTEEFVLKAPARLSFDFTGLLEMLESRKKMVEDGKEIDGIKIVSLQKPVLPTQFISKGDLNRASKVSEEVIDVKDYPEFIEIEY